MNNIKKLFGEINLTWKKLILFSILSGVYTGIMSLLPINNTSFKDITISFEVWILFGIIIIMNSNSKIDSALKCFVFFLVSQPLVYLIQVPFNDLGFNLFKYYKYWFIWTILTLPMGYIGYYIKKDKWYGLIILTPILIFLGSHYYLYLRYTIFNYPHHLLSTLFCLITLILYPLNIFNNKNLKIIGSIISILIIIIFTILSLNNKIVYDITIANNPSENIVFDDNYNVYIEDKNMGDVSIDYNTNLEEYVINLKFRHGGKTNLVLIDENGNVNIIEITVEEDTYSIKK